MSSAGRLGVDGGRPEQLGADLERRGIVDPDRRTFGALDGVRAIAVFAVMLSHFERFLPAHPWLATVKVAAAYGWVGVDLFFALSGFLITGILLSTRGARNYFAAFYARRTLRIFPVYYATLVAVLSLANLFPSYAGRLPPVAERPLYFVYLTNWIPAATGAWPPNVIGHFWSLAVEEQFYFVWPLVAIVMAPSALARVALALAGIALATRCTIVGFHGSYLTIIYSTVTRLDGLVLGAVGAVYFARTRGLDRRRFATFIALIVIPLALFVIFLLVLPDEALRLRFVNTIGYTLIATAFAASVTYLALTDGKATLAQRMFRAAPLRRIGAYSYGMYLFHVPLLGICEALVYRRLPPALTGNAAFGVAYVAALCILTFGVAALSYELFEAPILRFKRYFRAEPLAANESAPAK